VITVSHEHGGMSSREDKPRDKYNRVLWMNKDPSYVLHYMETSRM